MSTKRIQFNNVVQNQLPGYVKSEYPLVVDFLKSYYQGQEYQGGPIDLVQNIDQYTKVGEQVGLTENVGLGASIGVVDDTIQVDMKKNPTGTLGFPDSYGLLKINDEIITYTGITTFAFTGCVRGFVGVSSYQSDNNPEELVFESTTAEEHSKGDSIQNLSSLFLKEFLVKTKHQLTPGFESRKLASNLDQNIFIKQSKDFYASKGTDRGFEILFKTLYNENVKIIRPSDFLFTPSNANYKITRDFVVEPITGNPMDLELSTLYQDTNIENNINKAYAPITHVEPINVSAGTTFYKLSIDAGFNRDSRVEGSTYGTFVTPPRTRIIGDVGAGTTFIDVDSTVGFGTTGELHFKYNDNTVGVSSYTSKNLTQFFGLSGIAKTISSGENIGINTFAYGRSILDFDETIEVRVTSVIEGLDIDDASCLYEKGNTIKIKTLGIGNTGFKVDEWFYNLSTVYQVEKIDIKDISDFTYEVTLTTNHDFKVGDKSVAVLVGSDGIDLPVSDITQLTSEKSFIIKGQGEIDRDLNYTIERQILKTNAINFPEASSHTTNVQNVYIKPVDLVGGRQYTGPSHFHPNTGKKMVGAVHIDKPHATITNTPGVDKLLIASSSIPTYGSQSLGVSDGRIVFSGSFSGDEFEIITNSTTTPSGVPIFDHGFYTGDAIYYKPQIVNDAYVDPTSTKSIDNFVVKSSLMDEGLYFVKRINETTVKFAKSGSDLYTEKFVNIDNDGSRTGIVTDNIITPFKFNDKTLTSQKLLREVSPPENTGTISETTPGHTGILVNGVEILNYKSFDQVHYGELKNIDVLSGGTDYDVINPPFLHIKDSVGSGATGFVAVSGVLKDLRIIDTGFDYQETPTLKITGGNGSGANAFVNMQSIEHSVPFESDSPRVGLGTTGSLASTIGFSTYHKFNNAEEVIYVTNNQEVVGGLTTSSTYFASLVGSGGTSIRLHKDEAGALAGINTITLTSKGIGKHFIKSINKKSIVESINIISGGSGYQSKKRTTTSSGIDTSLNSINITNHDYESGEIIRYTCDGTPIAGLTTNTDFYVTKKDDDSFYLSSVGVGTTASDFYYKTKQYRPLTSIGVGTHTFNYQDITVSITGDVGISSVGSETFELKVQPIVRGEITSVHLSNNGVGYGASEIINFIREPEINLLSGSNAQLTPIVSGGKIIEVVVENKGTNYNSPPNLQINGVGVGAVITPVLKIHDLNGNQSSVGIGTTINYVLESVNVIHEGAGYEPSTTSIDVINSGSDCKVRANIQKWNLNLFERYYQTRQISEDDGIIKDGDIELQYNHLYAPRKLRQTVYATNQEGKSLYGEPDLRKVNGQETASDNHSPIIGWAYDGNPIYGPYGYVKRAGGTVAQMKSGYVQEAAIKENRPPLSVFPAGFFCDDFTYKAVSDETVLDENNGRFCVTPQYPNGTYAYFATVDDSGAEQEGQFNTFKLPVYPYLIGENYYSSPNDFNFLNSSNQDDYKVGDNEWRRNTTPYNLIDDNKTYYPYLPIPNNLSQTIDVAGTKPGVIESIGIETGGANYQVGNTVLFDNTNTKGRDAAAKVSRILGKPVSSVSAATSSITNVEIYPSNQKGVYSIVSAEPHQFINNDIITVTGLSTTSSEIEGVYNAGITSTKLTVSGVGTTAVAIGTDGTTGIVTHIDVRGDLSNLQSNDLLGIGTETLKLLNVEPLLSRIRVLRANNGVTGVSHTVTSEILEDPRRLRINSGFSSDYEYRVNQQIYFNPVDSVGLGTRSGVGIGTTIVFSNPGIGLTQKFIQTKAIFLPNHRLRTGDKLTYSPNVGEGLNIREDGAAANTGISTLINGQTVFAAVITEDLIGISTCKVGLGSTGTFVGIASTQRDSTTVFFSGIGTGVFHSFKTNYDVITGELRRITATVSTGETHGLLNNENVFVDVISGITTTISVKYNDYNRRLIIDPKSFTGGGVNTTTNTITINDHGYETGDKVIHTASIPSGGLIDNEIYYIVKVDSNNFKLCKTDFGSRSLTPSVVGISSTSSGTINSINPLIKVYKNSTVEFDLTDSSLRYNVQTTNYPAFSFNFYTDENLTKQFDTSPSSNTFNVTRTGTVGVSTDAKVTLSVTNDIPDVLYYTLDPIFESTLPLVKKQIVVDEDVLSGNKIECVDSGFSGKQVVTIGATNQFSYTLANAPERTSYGTTSLVSYKTDSPTAYGAISDFEITNPGSNYYTLPGITTIITDVGNSAIIEPKSTSVGKIKTLKIKDIGYDFPSDPTVKPTASLPQIIKIDSLMSVESVGVTSFGRGYISSPDLILIDGKTKKPVLDLDLKYTLGNPQVEILKNTKGIFNAPPTIVTDKNSNGIGIATVGFNTENYDVTVQLSVGFSTVDTFPIAVGDKVFIQGVGVGVGTTARGYNSANYDYELFTITAVDENFGGIGTVTYNLSNYFTGLAPGLSAGTFDFVNSSGRIVPQKFMPTFDIKLTPNNFSENEVVTGSISSTSGNVEDWNPNTGILRVSNTKGFVDGDILKGLTSGTQGFASSIDTFDSQIRLNATSRVEKGWETNSGFFNDNVQRIQDSDYYQNFSYSLSSRVDIEKWDDPVSTLNHTLGFKKFSDYQLESTASARVGLSTEQADVFVVNDLFGVADLNCVYDFDLVTENNLKITENDSFSTEITFTSRILEDFQESVGNRVVSIDDFSGTFNSNPRATRFSTVNQFTLADRRALKYIAYVRDKRFGAQRQLMIVDLIHDSSFGYINQYGRVESVYDQGDFDFAISGSEGQLNFFPVKFSVNDYFVATLSYNLDDNLLSTGSTVIGPSLVDSESAAIGTGITTKTIVGIASTYRSAKVIININPDIDGNEHEFNQLNIIHNDDEVDIMEYGRLTTVTTPEAIGGLGTYRGYIDGSTLKVDFIPNSNVGIGTTGVINTILIGMGDSTTTGIGTVDLKHARIESRTTEISSSSSPGITTIGSYPSDYEAAYGTVQVTDVTNQVYSMFEFAVVTDFIEGSTTETYDVEFANVASGVSPTGLGTFGSKVSSAGTVSLLFTPVASINAQVNVYMNAVRIQDDTKDNIDFNNGTIESGFGDYTGTESSVLREFGLSHKGDPIFRKPFDGSNSDIVDVTNNTINLPNHFFVTGEELVYTNPGAGVTMSIGVASTNGFVGVGTTTLLPTKVFAVKIDEETIKLAETVSKALQTVPETVDITSVGIGTSHAFNSVNQNNKALITLDNIIQSPVVSTAVTTHTAGQVFTTDDIIEFAGITSFFGGDLVKIGNEIIRIDAIGQSGNDNLIRVRRPWLGTSLSGYGTGTLITKVNGNYNIVDNTLNFTEAPYGNVPLSTTTNPPDSRDFTGIATGSSFEGRTFMRSGVPDTANEPYHRNYIFDSLSSQFTGQRSDFVLKSGGSNVQGITTDNAIVLINDVFQTPAFDGDGDTNEYSIVEDSTIGITTISFTGTGSSTSDVNVGSLPKGGIIVSVGSSEGFGYQPLVAAGGTVTVAAGGTIKSISIGNTGSGYRAGIQTVNVGIQTLSRPGTNVIGIGTAQITTGHITGVAVTNANHIFYSPRQVANVGYSSVTGISTITTQTIHNLHAGDEIVLSGIAFTCDYKPALGITTVGYTTTTGIMTVTTAGAHGFSTTGQNSVVIFSGLGFTCALDGGSSIHYYPRGQDRAFNTSIPIVGTSNTTITIDVGFSAVSDQSTHQFVSATDNAVISGGDYDHRFVSANPGAITEANTGLGYTPSNAIYDGPSGIMTVTVANHGLTTSNVVSIAQSSIVFRCSMDDYSSLHPYPRATDPIIGIGTTTITATTTNTFSLNVGISTIVNFNISTAIYSASSGILTMTLGSGGSQHGLTTGTSIKLSTESLSFRCSKDNFASVHKYPRKPDPYYTGVQVSAVNSTTQFEVNVGISTVLSHYVGFGSVQSAIIAPRLNNNSASKFDVAANGSEVLRVLDSKTFETQTGPSTRNHLYARGGVVNGFNKVVFDDPTSYSGINLEYSDTSSGIGTNATIDIVVGQGSSIVDFTIQNTGSGYGNLEKLTVPIGGTTGIPTDPSKTFTEFIIDIEKVFNDEFTAWSVGQLEVLDNIERFIDGSKTDFELTLNNATVSIAAKKGSKIDVQDLLLVFVNNIPQVPGKGYKFTGGSIIKFTEAPKIGDTVEIIFYKGTGGLDVVERKVIETVKPGDDLTIGRLVTQDNYLQETPRVPISVDSTDRVSTPPYNGPGNSSDSTLERPVTWCRQTEDKIINEKGVGKDREIYEPVINPCSHIIKSVGIGSTIIYVQNVRPYFDPQDEVNQLPNLLTDSDFTFQKKVKFDSQEDKIGAAGTAIVSGLGTISSVAISTGGVGYSTATVSFATTSLGGKEVGVGSTSTTAFGSPIIGAAGTITGIAITSVGAGYTSSNPPAVLISPPTISAEENKVDYYQGDSGIIVGFGTTTIGAGSTNYQLIFDLHIPLTSDLRDSSIAGTAVTISGISTGDFFIVNDSTVGSATTSINSVDTGGAIIGVGTQFINNVYEVNNFEIVQSPTGVGTTGVGIGTTHVNRVFVKVTNFNTWSGQWPSFSGVGIQTGNYFGAYSWGKINLTSRSESNSYTAYTLGGTGGISTSTVVKRSESLKYKDYRTP